MSESMMRRLLTARLELLDAEEALVEAKAAGVEKADRPSVRDLRYAYRLVRDEAAESGVSLDGGSVVSPEPVDAGVEVG